MTTIKFRYNFTVYQKLLAASLLIGFLAGILSISLKHITEYFEATLLNRALQTKLYFLVFPALGFSVIFILRHYLFNKKENRGIAEVFETTESDKNLPLYKIPSHFVNGLLTVGFGGSTGIEVSTVVATAAIGNIASKKEKTLKKYKQELACAGVAAGITCLFSSPVAGILFAYEVITRKASKSFALATFPSAIIAYVLLLTLDEPPLFSVELKLWNWHALPYFVVLALIAGFSAVYMTKCVLMVKKQFTRMKKHIYRISAGAILLSLAIFICPQFYGDGYHAIAQNLQSANTMALTGPNFLLLFAITALKPLLTSVTLGAGGDGGVFAPSIFIGAFLGLLVALLLNVYLDADLIVLNFMVLGMAAMLSASIHAPLTALFLVCGLINDYTLFLPLIIVCYLAKMTSKLTCPYNVYTFKRDVSYAR